MSIQYISVASGNMGNIHNENRATVYVAPSKVGSQSVDAPYDIVDIPQSGFRCSQDNYYGQSGVVYWA